MGVLKTLAPVSEQWEVELIAGSKALGESLHGDDAVLEEQYYLVKWVGRSEAEWVAHSTLVRKVKAPRCCLWTPR